MPEIFTEEQGSHTHTHTHTHTDHREEIIYTDFLTEFL